MRGFWIGAAVVGAFLALSGVVIYPTLEEAWLVWPLIAVLAGGWAAGIAGAFTLGGEGRGSNESRNHQPCRHRRGRDH